MGGRWFLYLDQVEFIRHLKRGRQALSKEMFTISDGDLEFTHRRMVEKETAECGVVIRLDHFPSATLLAYRYGLSPARPVQCEPPSAGFQPLPEDLVLLVIGIGARDVGDQELTSR